FAGFDGGFLGGRGGRQADLPTRASFGNGQSERIFQGHPVPELPERRGVGDRGRGNAVRGRLRPRSSRGVRAGTAAAVRLYRAREGAWTLAIRCAGRLGDRNGSGHLGRAPAIAPDPGVAAAWIHHRDRASLRSLT